MNDMTMKQRKEVVMIHYFTELHLELKGKHLCPYLPHTLTKTTTESWLF